LGAFSLHHKTRHLRVKTRQPRVLFASAMAFELPGHVNVSLIEEQFPPRWDRAKHGGTGKVCPAFIRHE
jgi:hypothetical protein